MPTSLGPAEILVILVVALIVLGPKRLPEAGRQVGKAIAEVRRWTTDVTREIKDAVDVEVPPKNTVNQTTVVTASTAAVDTNPEQVADTDVVAVEAVAPVETAAVDTAAPAPAAAAAPPVPDEESLPPPESPPGDPARL